MGVYVQEKAVRMGFGPSGVRRPLGSWDMSPAAAVTTSHLPRSEGFDLSYGALNFGVSQAPK